MDLFNHFSSLPKIDIPRWIGSIFNREDLSFPPLKIRDIQVEVPIIQGGMAVGISLSRLASAVSNSGGIGVIAATAIGLMESDYFKDPPSANSRALRKEIRAFREKSGGILGVNIMVAGNDFHSLLDVCIEEEVDLVIMGAGLPIKGIPVERLRAANIKILPIVSSHRAVHLIFRYWLSNYQDTPDAVVVEGPMAGGHLGFKAEELDNPENKLESLVPQVVETVSLFEKQVKRKIPVIAAGGIFTGEDICHFLQLGASGVQMGTRFVATPECDADNNFKQAYLNCRKEDIIIIASPVGLPGRAIKGDFFSHSNRSVKGSTHCAWKCLKSCHAEKAKYCIAVALNNARKGNLRGGFAFAGSNAYRVDKIVAVAELISSLRKEFVTAAEKITLRLKWEYEKAMDRVNSLKKEYGRAVEKALVMMREKYENVVVKGSESLVTDFREISSKIVDLKKEYLVHLDKVRSVINQLAAFGGRAASER